MADEKFFAQCARAHYEGRMKIDEFLRLTAPVLQKLAGRLVKRWPPPTFVGIEDVVQELMLACDVAFKRFDPARGTRIEDYLVYNACDKAKKWIHKQRGAVLHGNPDAHPSRHEFTFAAMQKREVEGAVALIDKCAPIMATQDADRELQDHFAQAINGAKGQDLRWAILALEAARGDLAEATDRLYEDADLRLRLRIGNRAKADRIIRRAASYLKGREVSHG